MSVEGERTFESTFLRHVEEETPEPVLCHVEGVIPSWLRGTLYRDGPGNLHHGPYWYEHMFDGDAFMQAFRITSDGITYSNKFIQSDYHKKNVEANRIVCVPFGTAIPPDPNQSLKDYLLSFIKMPEIPKDVDNCNVTPFFFGDELFTMTETTDMRQIHPDTLDTLPKLCLTDFIKDAVTAIAHPIVEEDGTVYNMGNVKGSKGIQYGVYKFPPKQNRDGKELSMFEGATCIARITPRWKTMPSYYHSFAMTQNYVIFIEQPFVMDMMRFIYLIYRKRPILDAFTVLPNEKTRFYVVEKSSGKVHSTVYEADFMIFLHQINAHEDDGHIVVDLCAMMENYDTIHSVTYENIEKSTKEQVQLSKTYPYRYVLPLHVDGDEVGEELIKLKNSLCSAVRQKSGAIYCKGELLAPADVVMDFPRINYKYNTKPYKHFYASRIKYSLVINQVLKVNTELKAITGHYEEDGYQFSEPVFVSRPGAEDELDGVVLANCYSEMDDQQAGLVILDPTTMTCLARARVQLKSKVPHCFHGIFAQDGEAVHGY